MAIPVTTTGTAHRWQGHGASPGMVRGLAHVIRADGSQGIVGPPACDRRGADQRRSDELSRSKTWLVVTHLQANPRIDRVLPRYVRLNQFTWAAIIAKEPFADCCQRFLFNRLPDGRFSTASRGQGVGRAPCCSTAASASAAVHGRSCITSGACSNRAPLPPSPSRRVGPAARLTVRDGRSARARPAAGSRGRRWASTTPRNWPGKRASSSKGGGDKESDGLPG